MAKIKNCPFKDLKCWNCSFMLNKCDYERIKKIRESGFVPSDITKKKKRSGNKKLYLSQKKRAY